MFFYTYGKDETSISHSSTMTTSTTTLSVTTSSKDCDYEKIGNGYCDSECDHEYYYYDRGDCCPEYIDYNTFYDNGFQCDNPSTTVPTTTITTTSTTTHTTTRV